MTPSLECLESRQLQAGLTPAEIRGFYGLEHAYRAFGAAGEGAGVAVAVVVAGIDPVITQIIARYDRRYHLPALDLTVYNTDGSSASDPTWEAEANNDVAAIHAITPLARIDLVTAGVAGYDQLVSADQYAANLPDVVAVDNSWGGPEFATEAFFDRYLTSATTVFVGAAGDHGTPQYPAVSPDMIAVGGFQRVAGTTVAWPGSGQSESAVYPGRTVPDVAMNVAGAYLFGTSESSAEFAGLVADAQGVREAHGLAPLDTAQAKALMASAAGDRAVFTPVPRESGAGIPKGPGFVRLLS